MVFDECMCVKVHESKIFCMYAPVCFSLDAMHAKPFLFLHENMEKEGRLKAVVVFSWFIPRQYLNTDVKKKKRD